MPQFDFAAQVLASGILQTSNIISTMIGWSTADAQSVVGWARWEPFGTGDLFAGLNFTSTAGILLYDATIEKRFNALKEQWVAERNELSSDIRDLVTHPAYQQIIGLVRA
jgi:hypothetical protein